MGRHDFRKPPGNHPLLPDTQLPTPNVEDLIVIENVPANVANYEPLLKGTPHPDNSSLKLVSEKAFQGNNNERMARRIYATDRAAQEAYNAAIEFVSDSATCPIYIRSYVLKRPWTKGTRNAALTSLTGLTLTNGGSAYVFAPAVSFTGGGGSGATAEVEISGGSIISIWLTNGGTGFTSAPTVVFTPVGEDATAEVQISDRGLASIQVDGGGSFYDILNPPDIQITGGGGTGAVAVVTDTDLSGAITQISVTNPGTGYTDLPIVTIIDGSHGASGSGATASATALESFSITGLTVSTGGTNYVTAPTITITDSNLNGTGATATAHVSGGAVDSISLTAPGSGFTGSVIVTFSGGRAGSGAAATALLQETTAVLVHEKGVPVQGELGSLFDQVTRVYSTQPGPALHERTSYAGVLFLDTTKQAVAPGTFPGNATGVTLENSVRQSSTTEAEQVITKLVNADGTAAPGFPIITTSRKDERTGITIFTDTFIGAAGYALPNLYVGGTLANIIANYPTWKQPDTPAGSGYGNTEYSPKVHYVIDARSRSVSEKSSQLVVSVDHGRIPPSRAEDDENYAFTFPAIFAFDQTDYSIPRNYGGQHLPPWPIGKDQIGGYELRSARPGKWPARKFITYSLGPRENLPQEYTVVTPGVASKFFRIPERCIHAAIKVSEELDNGAIQPIEDIPASTPSSYDPKDILVAQSKEKRIWGEIYEQTVVLVSEETPLSQFPDPTVDGYYRAFTVFRCTSPVSFPQVVLNDRKVVVLTIGVGGETAALQIFGRKQGGDSRVSVSENITATSTPAATTKTFLSLAEIFLAAPLLTDSVVIREPVQPSSASLQMLTTPADGDLLEARLTATTRLPYQFRTALTTDSVTAVALTAAGSGFTTAPTVSVSIGTGAVVTATIGGGVVTALTLTAPGTGYSQSSTLTISSASATAHASINGAGTITSITVDTAGSNYTSTATATIAAATQSDVTVTATLTGDGVASSFTLGDSVARYIFAPTVVFTGGGGTGAAAHANVSNGVITSITRDAAGSGYTSAPTVSLTGTNRFGQGGAAVVAVTSNAVASIALKTQTCTVVAATDVFTAASHTLVNGDGVRFTTSSALPSPLVAGTVYFARDVSGSTFKVAATYNGTAIDITDTGTGTQTLVYGGAYYTIAPTVTVSGTQASGATGTVTVSQANQILISSNMRVQAHSIDRAIRGLALGSYVGRTTAGNADLTAKIDTTDPTIVNFESLDPLTAPAAGSWTFSITHNGSPASWATLSAFVAGDDGVTLCTIPAGNQYAFNGGQNRTFTVLNNASLLDEKVDNDILTSPNCPAAIVLYTDWLLVPAGLAIRLTFSVSDVRPIRFAYQLNSAATVPTEVGVGVSVVNNSTAIAADMGYSLATYTGCKIRIQGDTIENELVGPTVLRRAYRGSTSIVPAYVTPLAAVSLGTASAGHPRNVEIGTPASQYIRLKITQLSTPYKYRSAHAEASWTINPDL